MTGPVLSLRDSEPDRPFLNLGGEKYHYSLTSDLSVAELLRAQAAGKRFAQIDEVTEENAAELVADLRAAVGIVMHDMPDEVQASLSDGECLAILEGFAQVQATNASPSAPSPSQPLASAGSTPVSTLIGT